MELFVGKHLNKVDKKGRVTVPKSFRSALNKQTFNGVYVFPQFKYTALEACSERFIRMISQSLNELPMFSDDQDDLSIILENTFPLAFDSEGRIILSAELLDAAEIESDVVFVGRGVRFQIWRPEIYHSVREPTIERFRTRGLTLSLSSLNSE
ncbi:MAG: Transcriptional regulator MraZ [Alphaproteobacteria bacterium MarineAlpha3_Bin5]|nr:division/cell wall cluster transcriptional repressor MraZ [Magnetovibrio sp.]PPR79933.1 MAG: Transcriptional regulator MraZ [Alphaproteobacteria bacterium MarineAlpha3_Bin5]|tara:strand:- start:74 stop:532 length:459 start_codon:yes stop_codon:yes gene_type:complete